MASRPSEPLVTILREASRKKGWNTATLAQESGIERARLKKILSGREPMLVDELIQLSGAMKLDPTDLGVTLPEGTEILVEEPPADSDSDEDEGERSSAPVRLAAIGPREVPPPELAAQATFPDPDGIQAEQILRLGFLLGCDILFAAETEQLTHSGVPRHVLSQYRPNLPIRLEAAYHRHNDPQYLPEGVQIRLSFDSLYTCLFPWSAIRQITLFPYPPEDLPPPPDEPEDTNDGGGGRKVGHLRVIE